MFPSHKTIFPLHTMAFLRVAHTQKALVCEWAGDLGSQSSVWGCPAWWPKGLVTSWAAQLASRGFSGATKGRIRVQGWTVMVTKYLENIFLLETKAWIVQRQVLSQCNKRLCVFLKGSACSVAASSCHIRRAQVK